MGRESKELSRRRKLSLDTLSVVIFFLAGFASMNGFNDFLLFHILGIAFIIAGVYGVISLFKTEKFIFNR